MSETCPPNLGELMSSVEGLRALPHLLGLLAGGKPVDVDRLAGAGGGSAGAGLIRTLRSQPGTEWDSEGRLVGFGITTRPTDYRFRVGDQNLYTWCASDTLLFTIILGKPTVAESRCPATGESIRVELNPAGVVSVSPPQAVISQRHRDDLVGNLRAEVCDHGHFFASSSAADAWLAEHPDGRVVSVIEAFAESRAVCQELGWLAPEDSEISGRSAISGRSEVSDR